MASTAAIAPVAFHPSVVTWIRERSHCDFFGMRPEDAAFYVDNGLVSVCAGDLLDFETREKAPSLLCRLTRKAMHIAYPDGVLVDRYKCTVCDKVTTGRFAIRHPLVWYPRKHRIEGAVCPGSSIEAKTVRIRRTFG